MSNTIDQRVVEMRFDNRHFEDNVKTTMSTLDKFKEKLNFDGVVKGLGNVGDAAKKVNITPLATAAESVRVKFSALEVMAITALQNITNSAINAGKRIVSSLTIDPVKMGFSEYELKMGATQTIMAGTGESLEVVNSYLNQLNEYSDKTIYSFQDMTSNIGKFTNAGVKLEDAVAAIKGVSNEAAVSGANANEASRAMYNFAQALSAGYVKLIDWKSIENANMATVEFKNQLIQTAVELGTVTEAADGMYETLEGNAFSATKSFNEVFQDQWLTSEVLVETLKKYADETTEIGKKATKAATEVKTFTQLMDTLKESAQSGWAQTWELLVGDFEEAKALFTELSDVIGGIIGKAADARNELIRGTFSSRWDELESTIENTGLSFDDFQEKLKETAKAHGVAIDEMIEKEGSLEKTIKNGWLTSDVLVETLRSYTKELSDASSATADLTNLNYKFHVALEVINGDYGNGEERIRRLTEAGFDAAAVQEEVNRLLGENASEIVELTDEQIESLQKLAEEAEKAGTPLNELIITLERPTGRELVIDTFRNALTALGQVIGAVRDAWLDAFPPITSEQLYKIIETIHNFSKGLIISEENVDKLRRTFSGLFAIIDIFTTITGGALKVGLILLCRILGLVDLNVLDVTATVGDAVVAFRDWLFENNMIAKALNKVGDVLYKGAKRVKDWIIKFAGLPEVRANVEKFKTVFTKALTALGKLLAKGGTAIWNFGKKLVDGAKKLKAWIDGFKDVPNVQEALKRFKEGVVNILTIIKESFGVCGEGVKEFIDKLKSLDTITLKDILKALGELKDKVIGHFAKIGGSFDNIKNALKSFKDSFISSLGESGEALEAFVEKMINFFKSIKDKIEYNIGFGEILAAILGVGVLGIGKKLADALEAFSTPLVAFGDFMHDFRGVIKDTRGVLKAAKLDLIAEAFKSLAVGILILVGAVAILTLLDQEKLWSAVGALAVLGGVLVAIAAIMTAFNKSIVNGAQNALAILSIAGAILILVIALKMLTNMEVAKAAGSILTIVVLMGALAGVSLLLGRFAPKLFTGSISLIAFAAATWILVKALENLVEINKAGLGKSLIVLAGIMGGLALVAVACKGINIGSALTVLAIVVALKLLIDMLDDIARIDLSMITTNLGAFVTIFGMFAVLMTSSHLAGQHAAKAGIAILAISVALVLIVSVIKQLAKIDPTTLSAPLATIGILMAIFAAVIAASSLAGKNAVKAGVMLLLMAGALAVLAAITVILSKIDEDGLWRGVGAIAALSACCAALIVISGLAKGLSSAKSTLITLVIAIGILALALVALSLMDPEKVTVATAALSVLIGMFSLLIASTKLAKGASVTIVLMTAVVAALGGILYMLAGLPVESTLAVAASLSVLLLALSASCLILSGVGTTGPAGLVGLGILAAVIVGVGALIIAIGALVEHVPKLNEWLDKGLPILEKIGYGLGAFFGSIVGGFTDGVMSGLPGIAESLSEFMEKLEPFLDGIRGIDSDLVSGVTSIVEIILLLTAANLIDGIASWLTGGRSIGEFSEQLPILGKALAAFSAEVDGKVDEKSVKAAANAGKLLTELASTVPNAGGLLGFIVGENDIGEFAERLPALAEGIVAFSQTVKGKVDEKSVEIAANAGKMITELADTVPNAGGLLGFLVGNNDIAEFGDQLSSLARGIIRFSAIVKGKVDEDAVKTAANAGKVLTELADTVPNTGGLLGFIVGNNDVDAFGEKLSTLAKGIVAFSDEVIGKIDEKAVQTAANAGNVLVELAQTVPNSSGLLGFIVGNNDIDKFGNKLPKLARGIVNFSDIVSGNVDRTSVNTATSAGELLVSLADRISETKTGGFFGFLNKGMDRFATQIELLGNGIAKFGEAVTGKLSKKDVNTAVDAGEMLASLSDRISETKTGGFWGFLNKGMERFGSQLLPLGEGIASFSSAVKNKVSAKSVEAAANAGELIATLSANVSDAAGSWISNLFGGDKKKFENFKEQMPLLGGAIVSFSDSISGKINSRAVESAQIVSEVLNILAEHMSFDTKNLSKFGSGLIELGDSIEDYYTSVSKIDMAKLSNAISKVKDLISMAKDMAGIDTNGMRRFGNDLRMLGLNGVDAFINAFESATDDVTNAATQMLTTFIEGAKSKMVDVEEAFVGIVTSVITKMREKNERFRNAGVYLILGFSQGARTKTSDVKTAFGDIVDGVIKNLRDKYSDFDSAGKYLVDGFAAGIKSKASAAADEARRMAQAAADAVDAVLDINSPSKVLYASGEFGGIGFVNALSDYADKAYDAGSDLADSARNGLRNAIAKLVDSVNGDIDTEPVIRPVLDLTNVESGARRLNTMFARTQAMSIDIGGYNSSAEDQNGPVSGQSGATFQFTQNNYSPKALSRIDIYRQTKNQFSAMERMIEA